VAGWHGEGSPLAETSESVTHHIVDRPVQGHRFLTREYVQPQVRRGGRGREHTLFDKEPGLANGRGLDRSAQEFVMLGCCV